MRSILSCAIVAAAMTATVTTVSASAPTHDKGRIHQQMEDRGYGMFIHFGPNTFLNQEWSEGLADATVYNPATIDADQWVRVARDAGFRYVLLVTKHHDGFCLWPSEFTDYDVASSPVKTDVVGAVAEACKKYGLQFAVYYSLWDRHEPTYTGKDFKKYVKYMKNQLTELMSNYGPVCELWLDGGWDKKCSDWQLQELYDLVKKLQPDCAFGVNGTIAADPSDEAGFTDVLPDFMTEDNRYHIRYFPSDFRLWDPKIAHKDDKKQYLFKGESYYMPFEHTICLSKEWNWFQKDTPRPVRELDELEELFYWSTDNNNSLVVNVPPAKNGRILEHEANAVIELGKRLGLEAGKPLPKNGRCISYGAPTEASSVWNDEPDYCASKATDGGMQTRWASASAPASLEVTLNPADSFNKISIFEYCDRIDLDNISNRRVNRITKYSIDLLRDGRWETIYLSDEPMGDCKIVNFPQDYSGEKIRFNALEATDSPSLYEFNVIHK